MCIPKWSASYLKKKKNLNFRSSDQFKNMEQLTALEHYSKAFDRFVRLHTGNKNVEVLGSMSDGCEASRGISWSYDTTKHPNPPPNPKKYYKIRWKCQCSNIWLICDQLHMIKLWKIAIIVKVVKLKYKYLQHTRGGRGQESTGLGCFPWNLISNNHNQIKTFVKCPSFFFFSQKLLHKWSKEQQTQRKKNMFLSKTYIQRASIYDYKVFKIF